MGQIMVWYDFLNSREMHWNYVVSGLLLAHCCAGDNEVQLIMKHRNNPVIRSPARYPWTTAPVPIEYSIPSYYFTKARYYFAKARYYFARYYFAKARNFAKAIYYFAKEKYYFARYYFAKAKYYLAKAKYYSRNTISRKRNIIIYTMS